MAFSSSSTNTVRSDINITPLVDVVLVLLIIFMVATPIMEMGLDVEVPPKVEVSATQAAAEKTQLVVLVKRDGIYLNDAKVGSLKELREAIAAQMQGRTPAEKVVFVNAEDQVPFDQAVAAMDAAHEAGAQKVGFLTETPGK